MRTLASQAVSVDQTAYSLQLRCGLPYSSQLGEEMGYTFPASPSESESCASPLCSQDHAAIDLLYTLGQQPWSSVEEGTTKEVAHGLLVGNASSGPIRSRRRKPATIAKPYDQSFINAVDIPMWPQTECSLAKFDTIIIHLKVMVAKQQRASAHSNHVVIINLAPPPRKSSKIARLTFAPRPLMKQKKKSRSSTSCVLDGQGEPRDRPVQRHTRLNSVACTCCTVAASTVLARPHYIENMWYQFCNACGIRVKKSQGVMCLSCHVCHRLFSSSSMFHLPLLFSNTVVLSSIVCANFIRAGTTISKYTSGNDSEKQDRLRGGTGRKILVCTLPPVQ